MPALFNTCSLSVFELLCPQIKLQWLALYQRGSPANELRLRHPEKHQHVVFTAAKRQGSSWQIRDIVDVFAKDLEDGSKALGFFNRASQAETVTYNKLARIGLPGRRRVRDLWRQKDLQVLSGSVKLSVPGHGVMLLKLSPAS